MGIILRPTRPRAPQPKATGPAPENVLEQYLLLANILQSAGLTKQDQEACLAKYFHVFSPGRLTALATSNPLFATINNGVTTRVPSKDQLAPFTANDDASTTDPNANLRAKTLANAKLDMIWYPALAHGEKGWITVLLHALAAEIKAVHGDEVVAQHPDAWVHNPDSAIWLGIMARLRVLFFRQDEWESVPLGIREAYQRGWRGVFGLGEEDSTAGGVNGQPVVAWKMRWADVVRGGCGLTAKLGAASTLSSMATSGPFLTKSFLAQQTYHPEYLGLLKREPGAANRMQRELRKYLGLPLAFKVSGCPTKWKGNGMKQRSRTRVGDDGWSRVDRNTK